VIGPGWLPGYRPRPKRHTLAYIRSRRRMKSRAIKAATLARVGNTENSTSEEVLGQSMLFDQAAEFPVATAVPREPRARAVATLAALQRWIGERWKWLRPRTVPCAVAGLGMVGILAATDYLAHQYGKTKPAPRVVHIEVAPH
jgi:hypothetical protein